MYTAFDVEQAFSYVAASPTQYSSTDGEHKQYSLGRAGRPQRSSRRRFNKPRRTTSIGFRGRHQRRIAW